MRRSDHEIVVRKTAAKLGARVVEIGTTGSGHRFALIVHAGKRRRIFFGSTPSDHRAALNLACNVRRVVRGMGGQAELAG
jgi:hypothetical protein